MSRSRLDIEQIADCGNSRNGNCNPKQKPRPPNVPEIQSGQFLHSAD